VGAIDGTYINCVPSIEEQQMSHNWKGGITQNVLICCSFDLKFQDFLSRADDAYSDVTLFINTHTSDLSVPPGKYYLADGGFLACGFTCHTIDTAHTVSVYQWKSFTSIQYNGEINYGVDT
jgi:hypothetical protein